jgi:integrase
MSRVAQHVLTPMATPAQQKKEISWRQLEQIAELADVSGDKTMQRDACMFMLAYHIYLRVSEIARMNRKDIPFTSETVRGETTLIMRVHVDRMSKNNKDRVGRERLVAERSTDVQ